MKRLWSSLRVRLAVTGFVSVYVPVLILFGVVSATSVEEQSTGEGSAVTVESNELGTDPWVIATAILLAPVAAGLAWWWAGRAVRPINEIQGVIEEIDGGSLERRIGMAAGPVEIVELAGSFDGMLDRLHEAADVQRSLIEDASHELRTPLAILETNADVALAQPNATLESYEVALERSRVTARRLAAIIDELLVDARGRARTIDRSPADLVSIVQEAVTAVQPLAERRGVALTIHSPTQLACAVDAPALFRAVSNLVDNAVRHGPADSPVEVELVREAGGAVVAISDLGPALGPDAQEVLFERFGRGNSDEIGSGLGLSIARHVAIAHGGTVSVISPTSDENGVRFELRVPLLVQ